MIDDSPPALAVSAPPETGRRLMPLLLFGNVALYAIYGGVGGILLPTQVENIDAAHKVASLGLVTGIAAVFATLFNPIGGALSDRTRSRFGRRAPWLLGAAVATALALVPLSNARSIGLLAVLWCLAQSLANVYQAALTAVVPDRIPESRRGTASAVTGAGMSIGLLLGIVVAGRFTDELTAGYLTLGLLLVAAALAFVALTRDPAGPIEAPVARPGVSWAARARESASALKHADFRWVFIGRALIVLGYFMVIGYMLYLLQDYIGLPDGMKGADGVALLTGIMTVAMLLSTVVAGPLSDRLDRRRAFVFGSSAVSAASLTLPLFFPSWTTMIVFMTLNGLAFGVYMSVDTAIVTLVLPEEADAARDMGVLNIANAGPQIAAPFVASLVIGQLGGYTTLFVVSAALTLGGALAILPVKSVR